MGRRSNLVSNPKRAGLSRGRSKILAHSAKGKLKRAVTSMSMTRRLQQAQEVNEDAKTRFFRPEKWKIMLTFFQIFSQYSSVYEIPWPEKVLEYMRIFKFFNLDFLKLVAFDCVIDGNLYQSFVITAFIPILAVVWIGMCLLIGRIKYGMEIKKYPRRAADGTPLPWLSAHSSYKKREKARKDDRKKTVVNCLAFNMSRFLDYQRGYNCPYLHCHKENASMRHQ